jgi:hypothetical protein
MCIIPRFYAALTYDLADNIISSIWTENGFNFSSTYAKLTQKYLSTEMTFASISTFVKLCWATIWSVLLPFNSMQGGANKYGPHAYVDDFHAYQLAEIKREARKPGGWYPQLYSHLSGEEKKERVQSEECAMEKCMKQLLDEIKSWKQKHKDKLGGEKTKGAEFCGDGAPLACPFVCGTFQQAACVVQDGVTIAPAKDETSDMPPMSLQTDASMQRRQGFRYADRLLVPNKKTHDIIMRYCDVPHCKAWRENNPWEKAVRHYICCIIWNAYGCVCVCQSAWGKCG